MTIKIYAIERKLRKSEIDRFLDIATKYYPESLHIRDRIEKNINDGAHVLVAENNGEYVGFSLSSCQITKTPFYSRMIPLIYQRQMYVEPETRGKKVGVHLQIRVLRDHLGPFWLFRRFALMSITHNPVIVKNFMLYTVYYPDLSGSTIPKEIIDFSKTLLETVGGRTVDSKLRVSRTYKDVLKGVDYTFWWNNYLSCGKEQVDNFVLNSIYECNDSKVMHTGLTLLMLGYAKPLNFVKRYLEIKIKSLWKRLV